MTVDDLPELIPVQKLIRHAEKVPDRVVQPLAPVAEEVQAQLEAHARVTLIIGKLDIGHNLLENIQSLVPIRVSFRLNNILENLLQTCSRLGNLSVSNLKLETFLGSI